MLLTDEVLAANADKFNRMLEFADRRGDGGPAMGMLIMLAVSDDDLEFLLSDAVENDIDRFTEIMLNAQVRFEAQGIDTE